MNKDKKNDPKLNSITGEDRTAMCDPTKLLNDDYWDLLANTRDKKEGPDGIKIWNAVHKELSKRKNKSNAELIEN